MLIREYIHDVGAIRKIKRARHTANRPANYRQHRNLTIMVTAWIVICVLGFTGLIIFGTVGGPALIGIPGTVALVVFGVGGFKFLDWYEQKHVYGRTLVAMAQPNK